MERTPPVTPPGASASSARHHCPDPYPHLREAGEAFVLDLTKRLASLLAGDRVPILELVGTLTGHAAAAMTDPGIAANVATIQATLRKEREEHCDRATARTMQRMSALVQAMQNATGQPTLTEKNAGELLDRAAASTGLWMFDAQGRPVAPADPPGIGPSLMDLAKQALEEWKGEMQTRSTPPPWVHVPPVGVRAHRHPGVVGAPSPEPIEPELIGMDDMLGMTPAVAALRDLIRYGGAAWWVNDDEPDVEKRYREAALSVSPETVLAFESMFGPIRRPWDDGRDSPSLLGTLQPEVDALRADWQSRSAAQIAAAIDVMCRAFEHHPTAPVIVALYALGHFSKVVARILPGAPAAFRAQVAALLARVRAGEQIPGVNAPEEVATPASKDGE